MKEWKERLVEERVELKEKFIKLVEFINSEGFYKLSCNNQLLLKNQKIVMELYLNVLNMRVYEDVDSVTIPDYGLIQLMGNVFGGSSFGFPKPDLKVLEDKLDIDKKEDTTG